jgi:glycosyltransferase involved in cell wall biosynthesis
MLVKIFIIFIVAFYTKLVVNTMKILMTAFSFEPCESSEPGVGWRFANIAARNHDVYVITNAIKGPVLRTREYLERFPNKKLNIFPFRPIGFPKFLGYNMPNIHYYLWQRQVISFAEKLHSQFNFDLIHHVTFSRFWIGSSVYKLPIPLIWGPVGSAGRTPEALRKGMTLSERIPNFARELASNIFCKDLMLKKTLEKASISFAMNKETEAKLKQRNVKNVRYLPQICFSSDRISEFENLKSPPKIPPINLLSVGRLVYWKGFQLGINAAKELESRGIQFEYRIVGWGPYENELKKLIRQLSLDGKVFLLGRKDNIQVIQEELPNSHIFIHPAYHESFGNVCLEALAAGKPVVCLNCGGPASQVTNECGVAVSTESTLTAIRQIADAIQELALDSEKLAKMSQAAKERARKYFHINTLENAIENAYQEVANTKYVFK